MPCEMCVCACVCLCVSVYIYIYIYMYVFPFICHTNNGSREAEIRWRLITSNNNIHVYNKRGNVRT